MYQVVCCGIICDYSSLIFVIANQNAKVMLIFDGKRMMFESVFQYAGFFWMVDSEMDKICDFRCCK